MKERTENEKELMNWDKSKILYWDRKGKWKQNYNDSNISSCNAITYWLTHSNNTKPHQQCKVSPHTNQHSASLSCSTLHSPITHSAPHAVMWRATTLGLMQLLALPLPFCCATLAVSFPCWVAQLGPVTWQQPRHWCAISTVVFETKANLPEVF